MSVVARRGRRSIAAAVLVWAAACGAVEPNGGESGDITPLPDAAAAAESATPSEVAPTGPDAVPSASGPVAPPAHPVAAAPQRAPNELGRIPILEYHLFGDTEGRWQRTPERFRADLEMLHARGYRPVTVSDVVDRRLDLPAGLSPVVITFDDASPGQFGYLEQGDSLVIDPRSAVGVWLDFAREHPDWENRAVFCLLSGAGEGRSFFGEKGIEGQRTEWRHRKVAQLAELGFELCNHSLWHANLAKAGESLVREQIARLQLAVDSAVPGYRIRTFALPLGQWPQDRSWAVTGEWADPKSGRAIEYRHDAVLLVAGGPARSPYDTAFDPLRLTRVQVFDDELKTVLDRLDARGERYVSDGDPDRVTAPPVADPPRAFDDG